MSNCCCAVTNSTLQHHSRCEAASAGSREQGLSWMATPQTSQFDTLTECMLAYPLCGILVTAIFSNELPQYISMAIPGGSQDTRPATLQWVVCRTMCCTAKKVFEGITGEGTDCRMNCVLRHTTQICRKTYFYLASLAML